jgi:hypothetical protein
MHDFEIKKRKTIDITGGNPFLQGPYEKKIVYEPSDLPKRAYDPRTDPNALLDRGSGILSTVGGGLKKVFGETPLEWAATVASMGGSKLGRGIKTAYDIKNRKGKYGTALKFLEDKTGKKLDLSNLKSTRDKVKGRQFDPKDPIGWTGEKKRTTPSEDRNGPNQILPENLQSAVSEGTQQFLSDEMKEQYKVAQNKMKAALASGYYTDQDGRQIQLSDEQVNALTQWVTKIDSMLVDPVMMADGGRVDKALGGRVRDI